MPEAEALTAAAAGTLARTPLAHLVVYVLRHRLDGTLVFTGAVGDEHAVYFRAGMPALVKTDFEVPTLGQIAVGLGYASQAAFDAALRTVGTADILMLELLRSSVPLSLEQFEGCQREHVYRCLLALFRTLKPDDAYAFHPNVNLATSRESDAVMPVDPYPLLWRASCTAPCEPEIEATLGRLGGQTIELPEEAILDDFGFGAAELRAVKELRGRAQTLTAFSAACGLPEQQCRRLVYVLLITRNLTVGSSGRQSLSPPTNPLRSDEPPQVRVEIKPAPKPAERAPTVRLAGTAGLMEPAEGGPEIALAVPIRARAPEPPASAAPAVELAAASPEPARMARAAPRFLYLGFAVTLVPLLLSVRGTDDSLEERIASTLRNHPGAALGSNLTSGALGSLPEGRILGAHVAFDSAVGWPYGLAACCVLVGLIVVLFDRGRAKLQHALAAAGGSFVVTLGLMLLMRAAGWAVDGHGAGSLPTRLFGMSYASTFVQDNGMVAGFLAYTLVLGLCQELIKGAPLAWHFRRDASLDWAGAALIGLSAGAAVGAAEAAVYAGDFYNGIQPAEAYAVRFVSWAALQAAWGGLTALALEARQDLIQLARGPAELGWQVLKMTAPALVLHGAFDTVARRGLSWPALALGVVSFAWLAVTIEKSRKENAPVRSRAP